MRPLPLIVHVGQDFTVTDDDQFLRDQYDKLENQGR
jgi:hypothetical protein